MYIPQNPQQEYKRKQTSAQRFTECAHLVGGIVKSVPKIRTSFQILVYVHISYNFMMKTDRNVFIFISIRGTSPTQFTLFSLKKLKIIQNVFLHHVNTHNIIKYQMLMFVSCFVIDHRSSIHSRTQKKYNRVSYTKCTLYLQ